MTAEASTQNCSSSCAILQSSYSICRSQDLESERRCGGFEMPTIERDHDVCAALHPRFQDEVVARVRQHWTPPGRGTNRPHPSPKPIQTELDVRPRNAHHLQG